MKPDQIPFLVAGQVAYFRLVGVAGRRVPALEQAVKVFGSLPHRDGPMVCITLHGTVSLWAPLTAADMPEAIVLKPEDWEDARLVKLRTSKVSLRSALMIRKRDLPAATDLDDFEGPRPKLHDLRIREIRQVVEQKHGVVWRDMPVRRREVVHVGGEGDFARREPIWKRY